MTREDVLFTLGALEILFRPDTICLEGYRARWSPATWTDPGEWTYDSRYDPKCELCNGEGCDLVQAREELEAEAFDAIEESSPATLEELEELWAA